MKGAEIEDLDRGPSCNNPIIDLDRFYELLVARDEAGEGLDELVFQKCFNFSSSEISRLRGIVPRVGWDGLELKPIYSDDEEDEMDDFDEY